MKEKAFDWLEQAHADLKTASDLLKVKNYYASVTFSQQAAEKGLKAVYILLENKLPPRIHDLVELGRLTNAPSEVMSPAEKLTPSFFTVRYPDSAPEIPVKYYTEEKAKAHLKEARLILKWSKGKIKL